MITTMFRWWNFAAILLACLALQPLSANEPRAGELVHLKGHENPVRSAAFLPGGERALSSSGSGRAYLWDLESGEQVQEFKHRSTFAIPTSDGRRALSARHENTVVLWDLETNEELVQLEGHSDTIQHAALTPDDGRAASCSSDGTARVWDLDSGEEQQRLEGHEGTVFGVQFTPNGQHLLTAGQDATVRVWNFDTGRQTQSLSGHQAAVFHVAVSPDGETAASASGDSTLRLWDVETGDHLRTFRGHEGTVRAVAFSADGKFLISGGVDRTVRLWSVGSGVELYRWEGHAAHVQCVSFSPNGQRALSGSGGDQDENGRWTPGDDFSVRLWRVPDLEKLAAAMPPSIAVLDFVDQGPSIELAPLRIAMAEMLTSRFAATSGLRSVERGQVAGFLQETDLGRSALVDADTAQQAGRALAAEYLLTGTFSGRDGDVTFTASLRQTGEAEPLQQWELDGSADELFELERHLGEQVVQAVASESNSEKESSPAGQDDGGPQPTLAVLPLQNLSPSARLTPMESGFADILHVQLSTFADVKLVDREQLHDVLDEQELTAAELVDPSQAIRIGRLLGAERLIYGSFVELGEQLRFDFRIAETETAAVLHSEMVSGATEDFATLLERLAARTAEALTVTLPEGATARLQAATPVRKIEAALHYASGELDFHRGRYSDSAESFERLLLIEPDNVHAALGRVRGWYHQHDNDRAIEAGQQALNQHFGPEQEILKQQIYRWLGKSYWRAKRYEDYVRLDERIRTEFPKAVISTSPASRLNLAFALMYSDREDEGMEVLEDAVAKHEAADADGAEVDSELYGKALRTLHQYHHMAPMYLRRTQEYEDRKDDPEYVSEISQKSKQRAQRALELYRQILQYARDHRENAWRLWGQSWIIEGSNPTWYDERGKRRNLLSPEERLEVISRALDLFSWDPKAAWKGHNARAEMCERLGRWEEAVESYRYVSEHPEGAIRTSAPNRWDRAHLAPTSTYDQQVEALYKVAVIQQRELGQPKQAAQAYQQLVERFGLTHFRGVNVVRDLQELGEEVSFPSKAVLVWGGGSEAQQAYQKILKPLGFVVHSVAQYRVSAAHLAPYSIVILARPGILPYEPTDILALRSYVATGGALLAVVSPGWEHAAPGIHHSLLSMFDASADRQMAVRARSTQVHPHPITDGISEAMAKSAVHLEVPEGARLIEAEDRTVLAAMPYRSGRVVLASFAQWFEPDPDFPKWILKRKRDHWTQNVPIEDRPVETGPGLQMPLLKNVLTWLNEGGSPETQRRRRLLQEAWWVSLQVQFQSVPHSELKPAFDLAVLRLAGQWREEALWAAGEASMQFFYLADESRVAHPAYGWRSSERPDPIPRYYQWLVDEYSESPLRPLAQWRLADARRRKVLTTGNATSDSDEHRRLEKLITEFEQVEAAEGSTPWAWRELRLGTLHMQTGDFAAANEHFLRVVEQTGASSEKWLAMFNAAICYQGSGDAQEARRYLEVVKESPDVFWWSSSYAHWAPLSVRGLPQSGHAQTLIDKYLSAGD